MMNEDSIFSMPTFSTIFCRTYAASLSLVTNTVWYAWNSGMSLPASVFM